MVKGMESFRNKFKDYSDCYTVIGGAACDILMSEADMEFRATKDIDIILIFENKHKEFAKVFWEYIREGQYRCGWKNSPDMHFYQFMMQGRRVVNDIGILDAGYIIPFKMYAWLDLKRRKESGEHVNDKDLKKHKNDVFRLLQIVPNGIKGECNGLVQESINLFLSKMNDEELRLEQMGLPFGKDEAIELLKKIYEV